MPKIFDIHYPKSTVQLVTGNLSGITNTNVRRFSTILENIGTAITYTDSATLGASFLINEAGIYDITYSDQTAGTSAAISISKNSPTFSAINSLATQQNGASESLVNVAAPGVKLAVGDIIRPCWTGTAMANPTDYGRFIITKVRDI